MHSLHVAVDKGKEHMSALLISTLQLNKGLNQGEESYVRATTLEDMASDGYSLPEVVCELLQES